MATDRPAATAGMADPHVLERVKGWRTYVEAKLGFRNHWYPTLFSRDVAEGEVKPFTLLSEKLLLKRIEGKVYAMKDRCLHRGVNFSTKLECFRKDTITCWYHGWTYSWLTGDVVAILSNPLSQQIGKHKIKMYPVEEAKGLIFVFLGDIDPPPLSTDVPPDFLDEDNYFLGYNQLVRSNWRVAVENGFDSGHIWIHKNAPILAEMDLALPMGFAVMPDVVASREVIHPNGPKGVYDLLGETSMPVFEAYIDGDKVFEGRFGGNKVVDNISIWLPCALRVAPWPKPNMMQCEWYVPADATSHYYLQMLGCRVKNDADIKEFERDFEARWLPMALRGFNDDDVWAREGAEGFYANDAGWIEEHLYENDLAIVEWRKFASKYNRGLQRPEHLV